MFLKILSIIATLGFGAFMVQLFFFSAPEATMANTVMVKGVLRTVEHISRSKGSDTLQIWLADHATPFRANSGYPKYFSDDYMLHLAADSEVELRLEQSESERLRKDYTKGQEFQPICALKVNGQDLFTLENFNANQAENTTIGRYVTPILTLCGLYLGWVAFGLPGYRRMA